MVCFVPTLEIPSGTIAYDERGSGPTIVMLPSGAHNRHDFDELRALLPGDLRTVAIDWPAHGESPPGAEPGSAMQLATVAEEVVEHLAPDGAIVLGNSVGGFSAARMAIRRPELVKGLVIVDGGGFTGAPPYVRAFCALMSNPSFLRIIYPAFSKRYMRSRTDADRRAQATGVATTRRNPGLRAVAELWRSFASPEHDLRSQAASIEAPTLVIWGKRDPVIPLKAGRRIAATIPSARLVVMDTGHVPHTSEPERFAAELLPFVQSVFAGQLSTEDRATGAGMRD
jgi:pimeloyl-ACP methyl ester carboxylesterase